MKTHNNPSKSSHNKQGGATEMSQLHIVNPNGRRPRPELVKSARSTEQDATYQAALELVAQIDEDLTRGTRHYRTRSGQLLTTLDEVVHAILADNLMLSEQQEEPFWQQEMAA
jgi:hypothetical protein